MTDLIVTVMVEMNGLCLHLSKDRHVGFPMATLVDAVLLQIVLVYKTII